MDTAESCASDTFPSSIPIVIWTGTVAYSPWSPPPRPLFCNFLCHPPSDPAPAPAPPPGFVPSVDTRAPVLLRRPRQA